MSRYNSSYDDDEYRLPEGLERIGYDADTKEYFFRSRGGEIYKSLPGNRYSRFIPSYSDSDAAVNDHHAPGLVGPVENDDYDHDHNSSMRYLLPFFVLVGLYLLLMIMPPVSWPRSLFGANSGSGRGSGRAVECGEGSMTHIIHQGDTCWDLIKEYGMDMDNLKNLNPDLDCSALQIGRGICVPSQEF